MVLAVVITAFALGAAWVYAVPPLQSAINGVLPASITGNKWANIAMTGLMILASVWIVSLVAKGFIRKAGA